MFNGEDPATKNSQSTLAFLFGLLFLELIKLVPSRKYQ